MIAALALVVLAQCVAPTEALQSDVPRAVIVTDGQAHVVDMQGVPSFVLLPSGLYLNEQGTERLNLKFKTLQSENTNLTAQNESLKNEVDRVVAAEGGKVSLTTVLIIAGAALAVGAGAAVGIVYAVKK